ncbi:PDR/VanB family oxidoreductase [Pseudarthrobacter sp. NPDC058196]|uniref:PDR/VanB family oxidoreductase n=1 Tax=Pseudarthrobacter sp. NPDC058196 TaxID=3346376 RepID=UPI0036DB3681
MGISTSSTATSLETEIDATITMKRAAADGVAEIRLSATDGSLLPEWTPGAHVDFILGSGLVRQYSLAGDPDDRSQYRFGVLLDPNSRGGSLEVHGSLSAGGEIRIRGPRNNFTFRNSETYVFVAGGIGITPLLPMIRAAEANGANWSLWYGGRTRSSMAFLEELLAYGERVNIYPEDERGFIPLKNVMAESGEALVYTCGPEPLLNAVVGAFDAVGKPARDLHLERFVARDVSDSRPTGTFEIELVESELVLTVPEDQTIVDVAREAGVLVFTSCEEGMCGTCETRVVSGTPVHLDSAKSPEQHDKDRTMAICVSRCASGRLVLDL